MIVKCINNVNLKNELTLQKTYDVIQVNEDENDTSIVYYRIKNDTGDLADCLKERFEIIEITSEVIDNICDEVEGEVWGYNILCEPSHIIVEKEGECLKVITQLSLYHTFSDKFNSITNFLDNLGYRKVEEKDYAELESCGL